MTEVRSERRRKNRRPDPRDLALTNLAQTSR
jgi:hypothetical protein